MQFLAVYEKRFHGPIAHVYILGSPFEECQQATEWLQKRRVHKNLLAENYTLLKTVKWRRGMFEDKTVPSTKLDYFLETMHKKEKVVQQKLIRS